jgi:hypothetical protein
MKWAKEGAMYATTAMTGRGEGGGGRGLCHIYFILNT